MAYTLTKEEEDKLDLGIRDVVKFLINYNFKVIEAGDGTNTKSHFEYPYIFMKVDNWSIKNDADRLHRLIKWICPKIASPQIEAVYDPENNSTIMGLYHFGDGEYAERDQSNMPLYSS